MAYPMPVKGPRTAASDPDTMSSGSSRPAAKKSGGMVKNLVTLIVIIVIIFGGLYLLGSYTGLNVGLGSSGVKLSANWQAVFLTNGQVYFGKIKGIDKDNVYLRDIYYLQVVNQPLQRSQTGDDVAVDTGSQETEQRLTLIKLGNELHGPKDEMIINRDHVILMEDLKDDSRVAQAISDYINSQGQ